jgi:type I restriction enzyme S subunit
LRFPEFQGTGAWPISLLGTTATFEKGRGISKAEVDPDGAWYCIRYGELYTRYGEVIREAFSKTNADESALFFSRSNDVIVPASGETKDDIATASCVLMDGIALGSDLNVIRSPHNGVFLSYLLNGSKRRDLAKVAQGDTVVHLYQRQLAALSVALPDACEQQKIADCLTSLDEVIAAQSRKVEALKAHKRGLMQQLFPREGETRPRLRFPEFRDAPEWEESPLGDLVDLVSGYPFDGKDIVEDSSGVRLMRGINITEGAVRHSTEIDRYYLGDMDGLERFRLKKNDLVIGMDGSKVGKNAALIGAVDEGSLLIQRVARLRAESGTLMDFIFQQINSPRFHAYVDRINTSSGIPHISARQIREYPIHSAGEAEQQGIADCLSSLDTQITAESHQLAALKTHKQGLMQQLLPAPERE